MRSEWYNYAGTRGGNNQRGLRINHAVRIRESTREARTKKRVILIRLFSVALNAFTACALYPRNTV